MIVSKYGMKWMSGSTKQPLNATEPYPHELRMQPAGAGRVWTMLGDSDGPMVPRMKGGGSGAVVAADAFALSVIELS